MYAGRIVEHGRTEALLRRTAHPYTAALLRSVPDPDQPVHRLLTIPGQPPDLLVDVPGCPFAAALPGGGRAVHAGDAAAGAGAVPGTRRSACWRAHEPDDWPARPPWRRPPGGR